LTSFKTLTKHAVQQGLLIGQHRSRLFAGNLVGAAHMPAFRVLESANRLTTGFLQEADELIGCISRTDEKKSGRRFPARYRQVKKR
jgi:hypothetical protein